MFNVNTPVFDRKSSHVPRKFTKITSFNAPSTGPRPNSRVAGRTPVRHVWLEGGCVRQTQLTWLKTTHWTLRTSKHSNFWETMGNEWFVLTINTWSRRSMKKLNVRMSHCLHNHSRWLILIENEAFSNPGQIWGNQVQLSVFFGWFKSETFSNNHGVSDPVKKPFQPISYLHLKMFFPIQIIYLQPFFTQLLSSKRT